MKSKLWWFVQGTGLIAMVSTPLWIRKDLGSNAVVIPRAIASWEPEEYLEDGVISSEVLTIVPERILADLNAPTEFSVTSKQFRFRTHASLSSRDSNSDSNLDDRAPNSDSLSTRNAASLRAKNKKQEIKNDWQLSAIVRKSKHDKNATDDFRVLKLEENNHVEYSSSYIELDEGSNEFQLVFNSSRGEERVVSVRVKYQKSGG